MDVEIRKVYQSPMAPVLVCRGSDGAPEEIGLLITTLGEPIIPSKGDFVVHPETGVRFEVTSVTWDFKLNKIIVIAHHP